MRMPVYWINSAARPTKVVAKDGDLKQVVPSGLDFSQFQNFAVLPDGSFVTKNAFQQGVPVVPDHLPKKLVWGHGTLKKGIDDFLHPFSIFIASENVRQVIEAHEPATHQFVPVEIVWKDGAAPIPYYWLYPCNRIDSINEQLTTFDCKEGRAGIKTWWFRPDGKVVHDLDKIGPVHMWLDRGYHNTDGIMISETLKNAFEAANLTGIRYFEREAI